MLETETECGKELYGYYPCKTPKSDRATLNLTPSHDACSKTYADVCTLRNIGDNPPQIGFNIGGTNFDILPSALRMKDDGANNCTAVIVGQPDLNLYSYWIIGNAFMQGKYIDHDGRNATQYNQTWATLGFATLKKPADPKSARLTERVR